MILVTGPAFAGKRAFVCAHFGWTMRELPEHAALDLRDALTGEGSLPELAEELGRREVVILTETGAGIVPLERSERILRERSGRLSCLLAARAACVVRVFCGIPEVLKGSLPPAAGLLAAEIIRHGRTDLMAERRYQGWTDAPLSRAGREELVRSAEEPRTVFVSPLLRARQTAGILFPFARQEVEEGLREMNFGAFEGRNFLEMENDPAYRAWVEGGCLQAPPGGESRAAFAARACEAFGHVLARARELGESRAVIVAHGGVQMAVMDRFGGGERDYYEWQTGPGEGLLLDLGQWKSGRAVLRETTRYREA